MAKAKIKISFRDIAELLTLIPTIIVQFDAARAKIKALKSDPDLAPLVESLEEVYRLATT